MRAATTVEEYRCAFPHATLHDLSLYYKDPDGNQIELQMDVFDTLETTNAWFEQSDFEVNFIGVQMDTKDLIARFCDGEEQNILLYRPVIGPSEVFNQLPEDPVNP
jgi:catechol-2,3-dioxygenase